MSFGRSTISPTPTMTGMRSSGREVFGIFLVSLSRLDSQLVSRHCEERERTKHIHAAVMHAMMALLRFARNDVEWMRHSSISAFMCSTASAKSSLNSCTTAPADFTLSIRPTPWPTK